MNKTESDIMRIKAKWSHHQQYVRPKIIWWQEINKKWEKNGILDNIDGILEEKDLVKLMEGKASQLLREETQNKDE
jgi:hypothetical protein